MKKLTFLSGFILSGVAVFAQLPTITSKKVSVVPEKDVKSEVWNNAPSTTVNVLPQNVTNPMLLTPSVKNIQVKSINDGQNIAFLLEWTDSTRDAIVDADKFSDQCAIQLPLNPAVPPSFMMGNKNGKVHIINWKAVWQDDIEKGFRDVKDAYPNYWTDIYPMHEKKGDGTNGKHARDISAAEIASSNGKNFMHGAYAGNPMSIFDRKVPCEEAMAEGFGTLTTQPNQNAGAWGIWENNTWKVIFVRPMNSADGDDAPLADKTKIAFALWNGNAENISGKKHYAMWTDLSIEK